MSSPNPPQREATVVVNQLSRFGYIGTSQVSAALARHGIRVKRAFAVRSPRRIPKLIKAAVRCGEKLVVVGGGDGTVAAVTDPLAYEDTVLGILPLGTGNDFARALGIPRDLEQACRIIAEGKVATVNLGHANGDYFANAASIGFSAQVSRRAAGWVKRLFGFGSYILGAFLEFWLYRPFHATLIVDGKKHELETPLIIVWNGRFHAGWEVISPDGKIAENRLIVYAPAAPSRLNLLQMAISLRMGRLVNAPPLLVMDAEKISVETDPPQEVDLDGEVLHQTPVMIQLAPRALKVMVPQTFEENA